ncbi:uncharacterized protein NECHADRAFT_89448 [Fusarium vanettenii 77-13-4]|uniref:Uncharacterized protein n=1 Tax=Fusarium vanettenii (strain ATCC MYA-4622 / CBS 123669 / FGSC 9596 / NRRL 45880 / 77-13-4) TaxID=660122 RepID=C7ZR84_FUSV7|nr:uncharacterized protein NECHADRAFT_89448 [Fusarium vanettenii 77-13-4]EEU33473.1 predicted protein [Fusarium vanettenii 77-13-4]
MDVSIAKNNGAFVLGCQNRFDDGTRSSDDASTTSNGPGKLGAGFRDTDECRVRNLGSLVLFQDPSSFSLLSPSPLIAQPDKILLPNAPISGPGTSRSGLSKTHAQGASPKNPTLTPTPTPTQTQTQTQTRPLRARSPESGDLNADSVAYLDLPDHTIASSGLLPFGSDKKL